MEESKNIPVVYHYVDGDIHEKKKKVYRLKEKNIYYQEEGREISRNSSQIVGYTCFEKGKLKKDVLYIGNNPYKVVPLKKKHKIYGLIETSSGEYIAFNKKECFFLPVFFPCLIALLISIWLSSGPLSNNATNDSDSPLNNWLIGGIEGTDVSLKPESEVSYNTYWGYQEITIDKTMKVPFVNKETNTSYAQFTVYDKEGNMIYQSPLIKPGTHEEWDAYSYYKGEKGKHLHDVKVVFFNPILDESGEISDFEASMFSASTPDFSVIIE